MRAILGLVIFCLSFCAIGAQAQDGIAEIPPDTPLDQIVCEEDSLRDTCWHLAIGLLEDDPARAAKLMEKSCALGASIWGCYHAGKFYLLDKRYVNYDRAYTLFDATCFRIPDPGVGPYGCKYLGHMEQLGLGRPSNVQRGHEIFIRACITHNDVLSDAEGCGLLAKSYLYGFDTSTRGRSPNAIPLAYIAYARGCLANAPSLCTEGQAFLKDHRGNAGLAAFLEECDADLTFLEAEERTCAQVFERPNFLPRGYAGARASRFSGAFKQFWRGWFGRLEPKAVL